jgi:TolB-like protein
MHMSQRPTRERVKAVSIDLSHQLSCHMAKIAAWSLLAMAAALFAGCSGRYNDLPAFWPVPTEDHENYGPGRFKTGYLARQIDQFYRGTTPGPVGVTTFVNLDDLYTSSTFGRMVAEQLMSELTMRGFDVVELRHSEALQFLDSSGEFALSRDVRVVRPERNLSAVVVGTYVVSPDRVYVNARLVDPSSSLILSAGSVEMSKTREMAKLLRGGVTPQALERIPVRHLGFSASPANLFDTAKRQRWMDEERGGGEWSVLPQAAPSARLPHSSPPVRRVSPPEQSARSAPHESRAGDVASAPTSRAPEPVAADHAPTEPNGGKTE